MFLNLHQFTSTSFNNNSFIFCHGGTFSCKSNNVVYLITCGKCKKQYVGETLQCLHKRMNGHRASVKAGSKTYIYDHFNLPGHIFTEATVQIIDFVDSSTSSDVKNDLLILENYWIETLGTAYPLGLNDKKKGSGNISQNANVDYFSCKVPRYSRGHGKRKHKKKDKKDHDCVIKDVDQMKTDLTSCNNTIFKTLKNYSKPELKMMYTLSESRSGLVFNIIKSFYKTFHDKSEIKKAKNRESIVLPFNCKFIDKLNLKSIIMDTSVEKLLPKTMQLLTPLKIFYKYEDPISLSLFNYGTFLKHLDISSIKKIMESPCNCESSPFKYEPLGHVITGNLEFITNPSLRNIMSYGCKYRIPINISSTAIINSLTHYISEFIKKKSQKHALKTSNFNDWQCRVLDIIQKRTAVFESRFPFMFKETENILEDKNVKKYLKMIKKTYIICSIDKASNNFSFVCKKFYVSILMKELGFDNGTLACVGNDTYKPCTEDEDYYIQYISKSLQEKFSINVDNSDMCLAKIFWNPKLHKVPYKARFIAGAKQCATKPLNVIINSCLKVLREHFKKYCLAINNNSGINTFWSIESSTQFLENIRDKTIYNLQVYDFTTLYTNLDLKEVEDMMSEVIDLIFSDRNKYICVSKRDPNNCFFAKKTYDNHVCFDAKELKEAVNFIIYNTYIIFAGIVFIQMKGIPMGGNSSSPIADLTIGKREFNYMINLIKQKKYGLAKLLSSCCRYVDDLMAINYLFFHNIIEEIYPESLKMERSGSNNKNVNYLDLNICIKESSLEITVYNKTDDFNFDVVSLTFPHSNIPEEVGYNVFYSQVLRYGTICSKYTEFQFYVSKILKVLVGRGYNRSKLIRHVKRCLNKYPIVFMKYGVVDFTTLFEELLIC